MSDFEPPFHAKPRGGAVWLEFKGHRRSRFLNPLEFPFKVGDVAVVEADRGCDAGIVRFVSQEHCCVGDEGCFSVLRRATTADIERLEQLKERENSAFDICMNKIAQHRLPMNLVDVEFRFDGQKLTFYFTSDGRVDFRELVRDLAYAFHTRIELRQIGARDEVKRCGGYGICGRQLCCVSYLRAFVPITTGMAKSQNLMLNPGKLSGVCGRLKCCLAFEYPFYQELEVEASGIPIESSEEIDKLSD